MNKQKISKTAVKILIASLSAAFGAFIFALVGYINNIEAYGLIIKIGIRLLAVGLISASTYDIVSRCKK